MNVFLIIVFYILIATLFLTVRYSLLRYQLKKYDRCILFMTENEGPYPQWVDIDYIETKTIAPMLLWAAIWPTAIACNVVTITITVIIVFARRLVHTLTERALS